MFGYALTGLPSGINGFWFADNKVLRYKFRVEQNVALVEPKKKDAPYHVEPTTASWWGRFYLDRKSLVLTQLAGNELFSDAKFDCVVYENKDVFDLRIKSELVWTQSKIDEAKKGNKI